MIRHRLFIYAFFFLVLNLNINFHKNIITSRSPSSMINSESCLEVLSNFYSPARNNYLLDRIAVTKKNPHLFFRSFPPLFYKLLKELNWESKFKELAAIHSIMAGDAHLENFGLKFYNGNLKLSVNDYDDLTKGPIFLDLVRLLSSARIAGIEISPNKLDEFLKQYKKGLKRKKHEYSNIIKDYFDKSKDLESIQANEINVNEKTFKNKKQPNFPISNNDKLVWTKLLSDYGEINDAYLFIKTSGGSAGLNRFQFLVSKQNQINWIEAKEWVNPSFNTGSNIIPPSTKERIAWIRQYDHPFLPPQITVFSSNTYYLRNIDGRQLGISIESMKKSEIEDVLIDEAYALGDFHSTYLTSNDDYLKAIDEIQINDLIDIVNKVKFEIESMMKDIKK